MTDKEPRDDLMGDLFDFDGDGRTSLDEECLAYTIMQQAREEENRGSREDRNCPPPPIRHSQGYSPTPVRTSPTGGQPELPPLSPSEYRRKKTGAILDLVCNLFLLCITSFLPIAGIAACFQPFSGDNLYASVLAVLICVWLCEKLLRFTFRSFWPKVRNSYDELQEINARRPASSSQDGQKLR